MPYEIQLAFDKDNNHVCAKFCDKKQGPFKCVLCEQELTLRAGTKTPKHFVHKLKSSCIGNDVSHRVIARGIEDMKSGKEPPSYKEPDSPKNEYVDDVIVKVVNNVDTGSIYEIKYVKEDLVDLSRIEKELDSILDSSIDEISPVVEPVKEESDNTQTRKCTDCKKNGTGYLKMFGDFITEKFKLHDIYVCPNCLVRCPNCDGVNSTKRHKRYNMCFECDDTKNTWVELSNMAIYDLSSIPPSPQWMSEEHSVATLKLMQRRLSARIIFNFFISNRHRLEEYKKSMVEISLDKLRIKALKKKRKKETSDRQKRISSRERSLGSEAVERYNRMYDNKKQACTECGTVRKRRQLCKYESIMATNRWACTTCVKKCSECQKPCVERETQKQENKCFECYSWTFDDKKWNNNYKGVLNAAACGDIQSCAILFRNAPFVKYGKYNGERVSYIPETDLPGIIRNTHPEMERIGLVIKNCRKM